MTNLGDITSDTDMGTPPFAAAAHGLVYRTAVFTLGTNDTFEAIPFNGGNAELSGVTHSTGTNPSRVTVTNAGVYRLHAIIQYTQGGGPNTYAGARFRVNATTEVVGSHVKVASSSGGGIGGGFCVVDAIVTLSASDYVELEGITGDVANVTIAAGDTTGSPTTATNCVLTVAAVG